ncbi:MFS transporter [Amycolatopsis sp. NPDC051372]|uniref:MFS transporter n=1 Tax=Amycolatopsis sp. NPDC051372 TaxID=3155669 RepID=UPI003421D1E4
MAFTSRPPTALTPDQRMHRTVTRKIAWRIVPLLGIAYFMANLERANLGIASLSMNESLGLTAATYGLAAGLYFVGYFVFEVPSNMALTRFGARKWLARIAITWGLVATATCFVQGPVSLNLMRILLGIAEAGLFPGVVFYFTLWFLPRDRAKMLAFFVIGSSLSGMIGPPVSGAIMSAWPHALFGLEDWRALFIAEGLPSIVVGLVIWKVLVDRPDKARWLSAEQKTWLTTELARHEAPSRHGNPLRCLANPKVLILSFSYFAKNCGGYVLVFFMPQIIKSINGDHLSTLAVSLLSAIPAAVTLVVSLLWAAHSDRLQERRWHAAIPMFVATAGVVLAAASSDPILTMIGLILATAGVGSVGSSFFQLPSSFLTGPMVAVGIAAINAIGNLGGFVGPYAFGVLEKSTGSFFAGNALLAALLAVGGMVILLPMFRRRTSDMFDSATIQAKAAE